MANCLRCGHHWKPRANSQPSYCPHCSSYVWDKPKPVKAIDNLLAKACDAIDAKQFTVEKLGALVMSLPDGY